jgi:hypothetical protein
MIPLTKYDDFVFFWFKGLQCRVDVAGCSSLDCSCM